VGHVNLAHAPCTCLGTKRTIRFQADGNVSLGPKHHGWACPTACSSDSGTRATTSRREGAESAGSKVAERSRGIVADCQANWGRRWCNDVAVEENYKQARSSVSSLLVSAFPIFIQHTYFHANHSLLTDVLFLHARTSTHAHFHTPHPPFNCDATDTRLQMSFLLAWPRSRPGRNLFGRTRRTLPKETESLGPVRATQASPRSMRRKRRKRQPKAPQMELMARNAKNQQFAAVDPNSTLALHTATVRLTSGQPLTHAVSLLPARIKRQRRLATQVLVPPVLRTMCCFHLHR